MKMGLLVAALLLAVTSGSVAQSKHDNIIGRGDELSYCPCALY